MKSMSGIKVCNKCLIQTQYMFSKNKAGIFIPASFIISLLKIAVSSYYRPDHIHQ